MNERQRHFVRRLRTFIKDCHAAGLAVVADAQDAGAIRLIPKEEFSVAEDLRQLGESVGVDGACGSGGAPNQSMSGG